MSSEWDRSETTAVGSVPLALSFGLSSDVALQSDDECDRGTISVRSFTGDCKDVKSAEREMWSAERAVCRKSQVQSRLGSQEPPPRPRMRKSTVA